MIFKSLYAPYERDERNEIFMNDKNREDKEKQVEFGVDEIGEDATKYGEFISTYFAWVSLPEQKEITEKLQNMTKKEEKER